MPRPPLDIACEPRGEDSMSEVLRAGTIHYPGSVSHLRSKADERHRPDVQVVRIIDEAPITLRQRPVRENAGQDHSQAATGSRVDGDEGKTMVLLSSRNSPGCKRLNGQHSERPSSLPRVPVHGVRPPVFRIGLIKTSVGDHLLPARVIE